MSIIKRPYLPEEDVSLFICDKSVADIKNSFSSYESKNVLKGINTHPDMSVCPLYDGDIIVSQESFEYYKQLSTFGINVIKGENDIKKEYPLDIAFNAVLISGILFHNLKYTDRGILNYCEKKGIRTVNVKQGYTKCSTLIVDEKSVVTCDKKLYQIYKENGLDALLVDNKDIKINGFSHGFIGGCGGLISKKTIGFFGDITKYSDFNKLNNFIKEREVDYKILTPGHLFDYGSIIPLCT